MAVIRIAGYDISGCHKLFSCLECKITFVIIRIVACQTFAFEKWSNVPGKGVVRLHRCRGSYEANEANDDDTANERLVERHPHINHFCRWDEGSEWQAAVRSSE